MYPSRSEVGQDKTKTPTPKSIRGKLSGALRLLQAAAAAGAVSEAQGPSELAKRNVEPESAVGCSQQSMRVVEDPKQVVHVEQPTQWTIRCAFRALGCNLLSGSWNDAAIWSSRPLVSEFFCDAVLLEVKTGSVLFKSASGCFVMV